MIVPQQEVSVCLYELATEYLRIGAEKCDALRDQSQLRAVVLLGLRGISIAQSFSVLVSSHLLDTFDAARRAFLESYYLQVQFRLKESSETASRWLSGEKDTWKTKFKDVENALFTPGPSIFGREYHEFSEIAHPTLIACQNSGAVLAHLLGVSAEQEKFNKWLQDVGGDVPENLFRLTWITFVLDDRFIEFPVDKSQVPNCLKFHEQYYESKKTAPPR